MEQALVRAELQDREEQMMIAAFAAGLLAGIVILFAAIQTELIQIEKR